MLNKIINIHEATTSEKDVMVGISMMTLNEYLEWQNKDEKYHGSSYQTHVKDLNKNYAMRLYSHIPRDNYRIYVADSIVLFVDDTDICQAVFDTSSNTLLYKRKFKYKSDKTFTTYNMYSNDEYIEMSFDKKEEVKYMNEIISKYSKNDNTSKYPILLNYKIFNGERFSIRMEKVKSDKKIDTGATIVVINELNQIVAMASNEWGATLIRVAEEYERFGIGMFLGKVWTNRNPKYTSGGYTNKGLSAAKKLWATAVRDSLSKGIYTEYIKQDKITLEKVQSIIRSAKTFNIKFNPEVAKTEKPAREKKLSVIFDDHVILFDQALYTDNEIDRDLFEDHIYAYGFFRENAYDEMFFYSFDYVDEDSRVKLLYCMLQEAKDNDYTISVGIEGESDIGNFELPNIKVEEVEGGKKTIALINDIINIDTAKNFIKSLSRKYDQYGEIGILIGEAASAKWDNDGDIKSSNF